MSLSIEQSQDYQLQANAGGTLLKALGGVMVAFLGVAVAIGVLTPEIRAQLPFAYLTAFVFYLSISLGALFFVMVMHLAHWRAAIVTRRIYEVVMLSMRWMWVLFLPIVFFLFKTHLYPWTHPAGDEVLLHKEPYLNPVFFLIRAAVYFGIWNFLAHFFYTNSIALDRTGDFRYKEKMLRMSAPGVLLFALTTTFAAFDWIMSLEPHWYSTIYGVWYFAGCVLASLSTVALLIRFVNQNPTLHKSINTNHLHDVGKLIFAFIVFWTYISFSQFLLIWMADIPEEIVWYKMRWDNPGWQCFTLYAIVIGHFILPFFMLLSKHVKRNRFWLPVMATYVLFVHFLDMYFNVMPNATAHGPAGIEGVQWSGLAFASTLLLWIGMGALYFLLTIRRLKRETLIPVRDPYLAQSLAFKNY